MKRSDVIATALALTLGGPLVYWFGVAIADGHARQVEGPLRALVGSDLYDRLARGERTSMNYVGDSLLAPDFTLRDHRGRPFKLSDLRGKVVVMNFWTKTCRPCVEEMPSLIELSRLVARRDDIAVVAVSTDESYDEVRALFPGDDLPMRLVFDPANEVVKAKFGTRLFPETWLIDRRGVIRARVDGPREWSSAVVIDAIEALL